MTQTIIIILLVYLVDPWNWNLPKPGLVESSQRHCLNTFNLFPCLICPELSLTLPTFVSYCYLVVLDF